MIKTKKKQAAAPEKNALEKARSALKKAEKSKTPSSIMKKLKKKRDAKKR